jgi:hypothetical protein
MKTYSVFFAMLMATCVASAQDLSFNCTYSDAGVQVEFGPEGKPKVSSGAAGMDPFVLELNTETGEARLRAINAVEVFPVVAGPTLSFIERTPSGISVITLYMESAIDSLGRIPFAQARHLDLAGPFPQQYYGICAPIGN